MSIIFPPSPPVEFGSAIQDLLALFEAMSPEQRTLVAQILVPSLPQVEAGATPGVDVGQAFVSGGFVVIAQ